MPITPPPPTPPKSPYVVYSSKDYRGNEISMTVTFGNDFIITSCTCQRDPACRWRNILFGLGPSGGPDDTPIAIRNIPPGNPVGIPVADLNAMGFTTIFDILQYGQITAS